MVKEFLTPGDSIDLTMIKKTFSTIIITNMTSLDKFLKAGLTGDSAQDMLSFIEYCHEEKINVLVGSVDKFWAFIFVDQCGIAWEEEEVEFLSLKSFLEFKAGQDSDEDIPRNEFGTDDKQKIKSLLTGKIVISPSDETPVMTSIVGAIIAYQIVIGLMGQWPGIYQGFVWEENSLGSQHIEAVQKNDKYRFLIPGVGAIGCELIKLFAQMGLCDQVPLTILDFDDVALSNLNRQILFRKEDMGLNKAVCAAKNVKALRPNIQLTVVEKKVDLRNPTSCSESLWGNVDLVLNALDSYEARATVHELCKIFRIPFINSGLNGTFTKNSVYVPSQTLTYQEDEGVIGSEQKEDTGSCTVRMRPTRQGHCLQWAREFLFEELFVDTFGPIQNFDSLKQYISKETDDALFIETRARFIRFFKAFQMGAVELLAINLLRQYFRTDIRTLQEMHPKDQQIGGQSYWQPPARFPQTQDLDFDCVNQWNFMVLFVAIIQEAIPIGSYEQLMPNCQIDGETEAATNLIQICSKLSQKSAATWIEIEEQFNAEDSNQFVPNDQAEVLFLQIKGVFRPIQFDKDNLFHLLFLNGACNLRLKNYHFPTLKVEKTNELSAKIAGQISYTSALTAGIQVLEVLKYIAAGGKIIPSPKSNLICDITVGRVIQMAQAPQQSICANIPIQEDGVLKSITYPIEGFSNWDFIPLNGNTTPAELETCIQQAITEKYQDTLLLGEHSKYRMVNYQMKYPNISEVRQMQEVDLNTTWHDNLQGHLSNPDSKMVVLKVKVLSELQVQIDVLTKYQKKLISQNFASEAFATQKQIRTLRKHGIGPRVLIAPIKVQF